MTAIDLHVVLGTRLPDGIAEHTTRLLERLLPHPDVRSSHTYVFDSPAVRATVYVSARWEAIFTAIRMLKGHLEETDVPVHHLIVIPHRSSRDVDPRAGFPPLELLRSKRGAWIQPRAFGDGEDGEARELSAYLREQEAVELPAGWVCLPFSRDADDDDSMMDYDGRVPGEIPSHFATHVSGSSTSPGAAVGLRIRMVAGTTIAGYVGHSYRSALGGSDDRRVGGANVVLTTLLQMNDKLPLVNHYNETLGEDVPIKLLSLPAMRMHVTDERAETDIARRVAQGELLISNVVLGR